MGFDKNNPDRILVCAYAYTGDVPSFLGTWSIDTEGERAELVDLHGTKYDVSVIGFKMVYDSYVPREQVEWEADRQAKIEEEREKQAEKDKKKLKKAYKKLYKQKLRKLKAQYRLKIREYKKSKKRGTTSFGDEQGIQVDADNIENQPDVDFDKMREERDAMIKQRQKEMEEIRQRKNKRAIQRQEKKKAREEKRLQEESLKNQPKEAPVENGENQ